MPREEEAGIIFGARKMEVENLSLTGFFLLTPVAHLQLGLDVSQVEHQHNSDTYLKCLLFVEYICIY